MPKILIVHGAGMNMRGKAQVEVFGPMTLPQYDEQIRKYASELGIETDIFHSNIEGEVINKFYEAHNSEVDAEARQKENGEEKRDAKRLCA